jgi:hypothetical protein
MDNEKLDPKQSKCFTCQFGLCMMQENTAFLEANFPMMGGPPDPFEAPPTEQELDWADSESEDEDDDPKKIMESRVCSLCYWAPPTVKIENPIVTSAVVKECSRYKKRDD